MYVPIMEKHGIFEPIWKEHCMYEPIRKEQSMYEPIRKEHAMRELFKNKHDIKEPIRNRNAYELKGLSHENYGGYCYISIESTFQGLLSPIIKFQFY